MKTGFLKYVIFSTALLVSACSGEAGDGALLGYVEADWRYVAAPQAGWIVEQRATPGLQVEAGDILFRLDSEAQAAALAEAEARIRQSEAEARNLETGARPSEIQALEARLAEAEARLEKARAERDRFAPLAEKGLASQSRADQLGYDVEIAEAAVEGLRKDIVVAREAARQARREAAAANVKSAEAAKAAADYQASQRTVTAGAAGRIEEVFLYQGEYATPGAPVLALLPEDALKVRFFAPEAEVSKLKPGGAVKVIADGAAAPVEATISYIAAEAEYTPPVIYTREERAKLVFAVDARLPAGSDLRPGLPVEIVF